MTLNVLRRLRRQLATSFPALALLAGASLWHANAFALPSCPTLIYEGVSPAANGLIDPGKPTITFRFNRDLVAPSVLGTSMMIESGPTMSRALRVWHNVPNKVFLFDDYGLAVPTNKQVVGKQIHVTPLMDLAPNRKYRYLIQGVAGPILAVYPDQWSKTFCSQPRITYNIVAEYYTRANATGGCVTSPTPVTTNRYGLTRGCSFNISYESYQISNEEEEITDAVWGWGNAKFKVRGYTGYPIMEQRGVKISVKNTPGTAATGWPSR